MGDELNSRETRDSACKAGNERRTARGWLPQYLRTTLRFTNMDRLGEVDNWHS